MRDGVIVITWKGVCVADVINPGTVLVPGDRFLDRDGVERIVTRVEDQRFGCFFPIGRGAWRSTVMTLVASPAVRALDTSWLCDTTVDALSDEWGPRRLLIEIHDHGGEGTISESAYGLEEPWARYAEHEPAVLLALLATGHVTVCEGRKVCITPKGVASIPAIRAEVGEEDF